MPLPQKAPGGGARNRRVHFPFICTPRGYSWEGYIAGKCHWFDCHSIGKSKPCLCEMTNGELVCEYDHDIEEPITLGYQPLWQKDNGRPGFVIVYEYAREQIDKLRLHHLVTISRAKGKSDTVAILYEKINAPLYHSTREDFMRPVDLTESLLRIWKMPELVHWYRTTHGQVTTAPTKPPHTVPKLKPLKSDGKAFDKMHEKAAEKYTTPGVHDAGDVAAEAIERAKRAEAEHRRNGHLNGKPH